MKGQKQKIHNLKREKYFEKAGTLGAKNLRGWKYLGFQEHHKCLHQVFGTLNRWQMLINILPCVNWAKDAKL